MNDKPPHSTEAAPGPVRLTRAGLLAGALETAPVTLFAVTFGAVFGAAAVNKGLSVELTILMSATVAAGAAQLATIDLWTPPVQIGAILIVTAAVTSRNILMGASLYPWLKHLPPLPRHLVANLVYEPNWVAGLNHYRRGDRDIGVLIGGGLVIYTAFVGGTAVGALIGGAMADPTRYGLDVLMIVFFVSLLTGMARQDRLRVVLPWAAAVAIALLAHWTLPAGWSIAAGGLAGAAVGALQR